MVERSEPVLVLVGMSVRESSARDRLVTLARDENAELAFLQVGDPGLLRVLTRLADEGHPRIVLVGFSLGSMAPMVSWLRRIASYWWRGYGPDAPVVEVATVLAAGTTRADLDLALAVTRELTGTEAPLSSPTWEDVPNHRHQVFLCRGPRCSAQGADESAEAMILAMMRAGLGDDDVLVTHTGCQFPCNQAPVVSVQPDDVWYGGVDVAAAEQIVEQHLVGGNPLAARRLPRAGSDHA